MLDKKNVTLTEKQGENAERGRCSSTACVSSMQHASKLKGRRNKISLDFGEAAKQS
jgi:hypothetical protein